MPSDRPIITLTTDFGLADAYVAEMKGILLRHCPAANLIDVTHHISPQDVLAGAIMLERAINTFDAGTVHLAVVDPGVGSDRRILIVKIDEQWAVLPDNGLITWAWRRLGSGKNVQAYELNWRPPKTSAIFHGRDILAPVAGMLAAGQDVREFARRLAAPILLPITPATGLHDVSIIHIDHFGNAMTNLPLDRLSDSSNASILIAGKNIGPVRQTYSDVPFGVALPLIGSSDLLEIAVRNGSAARDLNLRVGDEVCFT